MNQPQLEALGDSALLIRFGDRIDRALNAEVIAAVEILRASNLQGVHDIAPAYASVCVRYNPAVWGANLDRASPYEHIAAAIRAALASTDTRRAKADESAVIEIPVCYGGEFGPDLSFVAECTKLTPEDVIARHSNSDYRVAMLGFAPGFPYLLGLDSALQIPRRANPRTRVPAGSVAIGGAQTGIYPRELPGGWHLIGRTPLNLFDVTRDPPALLAPGMLVRFRAIDPAALAAFER